MTSRIGLRLNVGYLDGMGPDEVGITAHITARRVVCVSMENVFINASVHPNTLIPHVPIT